MAKKIENLPTSEIYSYISSGNIVINKCNQVLNISKSIASDSEVIAEQKKVIIIRNEHNNLITELQSELERRMRKHFGLKYGAVALDGIVTKLMEKISAQEKEADLEEDIEIGKNPEMQVLK